MATTRPFAYNTGSSIAGTQQFGNIAIGTPTTGFTGNPRWWNGPDETLGYIIAQTVPTNVQPAPDGTTASIGFYRSTALTESAFISIVNAMAKPTTFTTGNAANLWLSGTGYWSNWVYTYTYYRWQITNSKTYPPNANCVQASEFVFQLNGVDQSMAGVTVTNPSGSNPVGETPPNLVDGNTNTKALDLNFVTNGNVTNFIFQFSSAKSFNGYRWATANDEEGRDPKSWTISGSNDGTNWTTLHTVSNFTATTARFTYQTAQTY